MVIGFVVHVWSHDEQLKNCLLVWFFQPVICTISTHLSCCAMLMAKRCIKTFFFHMVCSFFWFPFIQNRFHIQFYNFGQNLLKFIGLLKWTWFLPNGFEMPICHSVNHFTSNSNFLNAKNQTNDFIHFLREFHDIFSINVSQRLCRLDLTHVLYFVSI